MSIEALLAKNLREYMGYITFCVLHDESFDLSNEKARCRDLDMEFGSGVMCASFKLVILRLASLIAKTWPREEWNREAISGFLHLKVKMVFKRTGLLGRNLLNELARELKEELIDLR